MARSSGRTRSASMQKLRQRVVAAYYLGRSMSARRAPTSSTASSIGWQDNPHLEDNAFPVTYAHTGEAPGGSIRSARASCSQPSRGKVRRRRGGGRTRDQRALGGVRRSHCRQLATEAAAKPQPPTSQACNARPRGRQRNVPRKGPLALDALSARFTAPAANKRPDMLCH